MSTTQLRWLRAFHFWCDKTSLAKHQSCTYYDLSNIHYERTFNLVKFFNCNPVLIYTKTKQTEKQMKTATS